MLLIFLLFALYPFSCIFSKLQQFFSEPGNAVNLALFRIFYFGIVAGGITAPLVLSGMEKIDFPWGNMPHDARVPLPGIGWLIAIIPITPSTVEWALRLLFLSAFLSMIGLWTRMSMLVYVVMAFYIIGVPNFFGKVNHGHYLVWFPAVLAFSPCFDALSVDAWLKKRKKGTGDEGRGTINYSFPIKVIWLLFGIIYFFPGFWKVWDCGLDWALTDNVRNQMQLKWIDLNGWLPFFRIDHYPLLYKLAGIYTIIFELGFVLLLFNKKTRIAAIIGGLLFHGFTFLFMQISFYKLVMCYVFFIGTRDRGRGTGHATSSSTVVLRPSSLLTIIATILLSANIICGIFKITSFPFACYPTFAYLVPSETETLSFTTIDSSGKETPLDKSMLQKTFSSERYRAWEYKLIAAQKENNKEEINKWGRNFYDFFNIQQPLNIYMETIPLSPDSVGKPVKRALIEEVK